MPRIVQRAEACRWPVSGAGMISFGEKKPSNGPFISKVRRWVENALPAEHEDTVVMVNELQCFEPVRRCCVVFDVALHGSGSMVVCQHRDGFSGRALWQPPGRSALHLPCAYAGLRPD
jgi:hypothetical protein